MALKRQKAKTARSRSTPRSRNTSRSRAISRKRTISRSASRLTALKPKPPSSETKIARRRSPSTSEEEATRKPKARASPIRRTRTRSSVRVIERMEHSLVGSKLESSPVKPDTPKIGLFRKFGCGVHSLANKFLECVFSEEMESLFSFFVIPLFVYWCVFLAVKPTPAAMFSNVPSPFGKAFAFCGAAIPYDFGLLNPFVVVGVHIFCATIFIVNRIIPSVKRSMIIGGRRRTEYKANGLLVLIVFGILLAGFELKGRVYVGGGRLSIADITSHFPSLLIGAWLLAFLMSIWAYWHSRHMRPYSTTVIRITGNKFIDFCNGREIRPRVWGFDPQALVYYPAIIGCCILQVALAIKYHADHDKVSPALFSMVALHVVASLDLLLFEPTLLNSHETLKSGFGMKHALRLLLVEPFMRSVGVVFLAFSSSQVDSCDGLLMGMAVLVFFLGLWIRRRSTNQKFLFRCDPHHPSFEGLNVIPMSSGKRILAGGWWGRIRHPDDLGEILMAVGVTLPAGIATGIIPWILPIVIVVSKVIHARKSERLAAEKYGTSAWLKYTSGVPFRFVPRVY